MNQATVITFDDFQPGTVLGETTEVASDTLAGRWQRIFGARAEDGAGGAAEGASLVVVMMMRAYLGVVTPRPPGNVHARQQFALQAPPRRGEAVRSVVSCAAKEMRRGRRYVELLVQGSGDDGRAIYTGRLSLVWAA
jgi:hypothetical protein